MNIQEEREAAEKLKAWKMREFYKESPEAKKQRRKEICSKCRHWGGECCSYVINTGHQKPCPGSLCIEYGIFEEATDENKKRVKPKVVMYNRKN